MKSGAEVELMRRRKKAWIEVTGKDGVGVLEEWFRESSDGPD